MVEQRDDDPWAAARASQRDDVRAALAPRERRCPACGAPQSRGGRVCSECGADLTARYAKGASRRKQLYAALAVLVLIAVSIPIVASWREDAAGERERAERRQAALEAAERERLARDARPVRAEGRPAAAGADPLKHRVAVVTEAESLITEDARGRAAAGTIDGDIRGTECNPFPDTEERRRAEQDTATAVGRYDCVAYTSKFEAPELDGQKRTGLFGYPYWLVVDYEDAQLVWCKVTPRAGEGGRSLAAVPVPAPCRDPAGPG
jgi:predicted nucleic acid-binding Zn ribbon protein